MTAPGLLIGHRTLSSVDQKAESQRHYYYYDLKMDRIHSWRSGGAECRLDSCRGAWQGSRRATSGKITGRWEPRPLPQRPRRDSRRGIATLQREIRRRVGKVATIPFRSWGARGAAGAQMPTLLLSRISVPLCRGCFFSLFQSARMAAVDAISKRAIFAFWLGIWGGAGLSSAQRRAMARVRLGGV